MFRVFTRTANSFEQFAKARKRTVRVLPTDSEAREFCRRENDARTPAQVARGFKFEFERY